MSEGRCTSGDEGPWRNVDDSRRETLRATPSGSRPIVPTIKKRKKSLMFAALAGSADPTDATDALFATDNCKAGVLIGQYATVAAFTNFGGKQLSGRQRQCVAVARSAAFARQVVILDAPTVAIGVKQGNMVLVWTHRVRDQALPVSLVGRNMPPVLGIADRIHLARRGKRACFVNSKCIGVSDIAVMMTGARLAIELPADAWACGAA